MKLERYIYISILNSQATNLEKSMKKTNNRSNDLYILLLLMNDITTFEYVYSNILSTTTSIAG